MYSIKLCRIFDKEKRFDIIDAFLELITFARHWF